MTRYVLYCQNINTIDKSQYNMEPHFKAMKMSIKESWQLYHDLCIIISAPGMSMHGMHCVEEDTLRHGTILVENGDRQEICLWN